MNTRYQIIFFTELNADGSFISHDGVECVTVGITTKPDRFINHAKMRSNKDLFFFFIGKIKSHTNFLREIEELSLSKDVYQLAPLTDLLRRKCVENDFQPYRLKKKYNKKTTGSQAVLHLDD